MCNCYYDAIVCPQNTQSSINVAVHLLVSSEFCVRGTKFAFPRQMFRWQRKLNHSWNRIISLANQDSRINIWMAQLFSYFFFFIKDSTCLNCNAARWNEHWQFKIGQLHCHHRTISDCPFRKSEWTHHLERKFKRIRWTKIRLEKLSTSRSIADLCRKHLWEQSCKQNY